MTPLKLPPEADVLVRACDHRQPLIEALTFAVTALNTAPRFQVPSLDMDSYEIPSVCERALATAKESTV